MQEQFPGERHIRGDEDGAPERNGRNAPLAEHPAPKAWGKAATAESHRHQVGKAMHQIGWQCYPASAHGGDEALDNLHRSPFCSISRDRPSVRTTTVPDRSVRNIAAPLCARLRRTDWLGCP